MHKMFLIAVLIATLSEIKHLKGTYLAILQLFLLSVNLVRGALHETQFKIVLIYLILGLNVALLSVRSCFKLLYSPFKLSRGSCIPEMAILAILAPQWHHTEPWVEKYCIRGFRAVWSLSFWLTGSTHTYTDAGRCIYTWNNKKYGNTPWKKKILQIQTHICAWFRGECPHQCVCHQILWPVITVGVTHSSNFLRISKKNPTWPCKVSLGVKQQTQSSSPALDFCYYGSTAVGAVQTSVTAQ